MWLHEHITEETSSLLCVRDDRNDFSFEMSGQTPVQAFGEIGGREFCFRARRNEWSCEVSDADGQLRSYGRAGPDGFIRRGEYANASCLSLREALKIIDRCMQGYLNSSAES